MIRITDSISINEDDIQVRFIRSPGPGGQHVNKVESAVQIRFDAASCVALRGSIFERLKRLAGSRMTGEGTIIITANSTRSQLRNKEEANERLVDLIRRASIAPKKRKKTRPTRASKERRLVGKKRKANLKKTRQKQIDQ